MDNKAAKKCHGEMLLDIARELSRYIKANPGAVLVREKALDVISRSARTVEVLHKVVGMSDLYAWWLEKTEFEEVPVKTVKSLVANDKDAGKELVASSLDQFVGHREYARDDESDAVAVGVAWLIQRGMIDSPYSKKEGKS